LDISNVNQRPSKPVISTFSILKAKGGISDQTEISECLNGPNFQAKPTAVKKFLFILPYIYKRDRDKFKEMLKISGKKRKYFALSLSCGPGKTFRRFFMITSTCENRS
jgi:negative regulator of replication initiation